MSNFKISKVRISGISACVPSQVVKNRDSDLISKEDMEQFITSTGVEERRIASDDICASDLGLVAANKLIEDLKWDKNDIDILVLVTQSADYVLPVTSAILQDRLGLSKGCIAFDIPLGCSGYVYGLSVIGAFMQSTGLKKGLLIVGDMTQLISKLDKSTGPLFGAGVTATALTYDETAPDMLFDLGTDGSGYKAIIVPDGGTRNPVNAQSLVLEETEPGIVRNRCQLSLDGMDVFSFGISQVPKTVNMLLNTFNINKEGIDYFVFHQANMMMNKMIAKKLKLPDAKVPYSLQHFGNTSSATIPLTVVTALKDRLDEGGTLKLILCGFGVGLSWGTAYVELSNVTCSSLIEYDAQ